MTIRDLDNLVLGVIAAAIALGFFLSGCDHPVQQQAAAIDVTAQTVAQAAHVVADAALADAQATCPEGSDPACLDPVEARWAPADATIGSIRTALGAWLLADRIAMQTNAPLDLAAVAQAVAQLARLYEELRATLVPLHVEIPPLPGQILSLLPPVTSGGSSP